MTTDSCGISNFTTTLGGDSTRKNEEGYIYLPKDQSSITYSQPDRTFTLERSGLTIYFAEDGQDYTAERTLAFSNDYNNFTITNGWVAEDDLTECDGDETGSGIRVGTVGVEIGYNYIQYRSPWSQYRGFMVLTKDGIPVVQADINEVELKDNNGDPVNPASVGFYSSTYFSGMWNAGTASVDFSGPVSIAGPTIGYLNLPADDYTWEVTTSDDKLVSETINYPGQKVLPVVDSGTMQSVWQPDGSATLSWTNPPNIAPGDYDQLRVVINDGDSEMLNASLPSNVNKMTIPSEWVDILGKYFDPITNPRWQVQTRSHTAEDMNYARGYSDWVPIPPAPATQPLPGEWSGSAGFGELSFTVDSTSTSITQIFINYIDFSCGGVLSNGSRTVTSSWPITDRQFNITTSDSEITIIGTFDETGKNASGTYDAVFIGTTCSGTWDATPN